MCKKYIWANVQELYLGLYKNYTWDNVQELYLQELYLG